MSRYIYLQIFLYNLNTIINFKNNHLIYYILYTCNFIFADDL